MTKNNLINQNQEPRNSVPRPEQIALFCLLAIIALYAFSPLEDYDFWWHLKAGEIIYQTKDIVRQDVFSFTSPGAYWIDHSWLAELAIFGAWQGGGVRGVLLLKVFFIVAAFFFLHMTLRRQVEAGAPAYVPLLFLLVTAAAAAAARVGWEARPQTFTYLFFTLFLFLLESRRARWLLPLVMVIWANSHGSFFFGLIILGCYLTEAGILKYKNKFGKSHYDETEPRPNKPAGDPNDREFKILLFLLLGVFAASLINPHPFKLYTHPWIHLHQVFPKIIAEWVSPAFTDAPAFWIILAITLLVLPLALKKIRPARLLLFLLFLIPALRYLRNVPYLTIAAAPLLGQALMVNLQWLEAKFPRLATPLEKPAKPAGEEYARPRPLLNPLYLLSALFLLFLLLSPAAGWVSIGGVNYRRFPQKAVDFYQAVQVPGPLFNTYEWGGYLSFRLWPQEKVFILGITSDEEIFQQYFSITGGQAGWRRLLDEHRINAILTRTCYDEGGMLPYIAKLYLDPDWRLIYQDDAAVLLVRSGENNRHLEPYALPKENLFLTLLAEENRLLQRKPLGHHLLYYKALAQYALGDRREAEKTLNLLQKINPAYPTAAVLRHAVQKNINLREFLQENYGR